MTATAKIISWINEPGHPVWWKHTLKLLLESPILTPEHHAQIYKIARKEAGFTEDVPEFSSYSDPLRADGYHFEEKPVVLVSLGPTMNVASLSREQVLPFAESGITVIYGDNGVGKSSYAKILKNCCLTRGEKPPVVGNIFEQSTLSPSAIVRYSIGTSAAQVAEWTYKGADTPDLKAIRVFDTKSAMHYVEKEGELGYRPAGLHLLDGMGAACRFVKGEVEKKLVPLALAKDIPLVEANTAAGNFLKSITHQSTAAQLDAHCISDVEMVTLEAVQREIWEMNTKTASEIKKGINRKIQAITPFLKTLTDASAAVADAKFCEVQSLRDGYIKKAATAEAARAIAFGEMNVFEIGSPSWGDFWNAAKSFVQLAKEPQPFPPKEGDSCPLCLQEVSENASARLEKFERYVCESVQLDAATAKVNLNKKLAQIRSLHLDLSPFSALISELEESLYEIKNQAGAFEAEFSLKKELLLSDDMNFVPLEVAIPVPGFKLIEKLTAYKTELEQRSELLIDEQGFARVLDEKRAAEKDLKAKKALRDGRGLVEAEIKRKKALAFYTLIKSQTNPRAITAQSNAICADYLTKSLKEYFDQELAYFGFRNYEVVAEVRGSDASQLFKLKLSKASATNVSVIASEGELKCLALAGIFAELRADGRKSGVVFDDPVNSLDHKWRTKVAGRMVELGKEIQVIIFTHDIVFLKNLLETSEHSVSAKINVINLDRGRRSTGIITPSPPWDALSTSKRIKYLDNLYKELKKLDVDGTDQEYDKQAGSFYGYLREAWERLVEEKLLNKVVERFGRGVQTLRLKRLTDISDEDIGRIDSAMGKCSGLFKGHDSAPSVHQGMPRLDEIAKDIDNIKLFEQELTGQRKRAG